nr:MAG TPA: hypothetical protein [Caudoviricetes sp.]
MSIFFYCVCDILLFMRYFVLTKKCNAVYNVNQERR